MNAGVPGSEIRREEEGRERDDHAQCPAGPVHRLTCNPRDDEQERESERQAPEARGDRPDFGKPDEPGPEGEQAAADQQCRKCEGVMMRPVHKRRLGPSPSRSKLEPHVSAIKQTYGLRPRIELKRPGAKLFAPRLLERVTKKRKDPNADSF